MTDKPLSRIKEQGNFELEKLASMPSFYFPTLSHDESKLAFYWDKTGRNELYIMDFENNNKITKMTDGELPRALRAGFIWSRDDTKILFTKDKDGNEQHDIYEFELVTKKVTQLIDSPTAQEYIVDSSPDGQWYTLSSNRHGQMNIFRMSADGKTVEQLTGHENPAFGGKYSPNGEWIVYSSNEEANLKNSDIYLVKPDASEGKRVVQIKVGSQDGFGSWAEDSNSFAFTSDASGIAQAGIYNLTTDEVKFYGSGKYDEHAVKITNNGKLICLKNKNSSISPVIYDITTSERQAINFPVGIAAGSELKDNKLLLLSMNTPTAPNKLVQFNIETSEMIDLIPADTNGINPQLFIDGEHIFYTSLDGTKIPAVVYKPRNWTDDASYSALIVPHGGPTGQYFMNFSFMAQYFTDLGYVTMFPNVRGSTGYGVEFRDACLKDWGGKDHEDWVAGRQYLIDNYSVHPKKVGVFGGSYGGYATLVCLTKSPDLWAAGAAWIPVSHLKNMYGKSMEHFKYFLREQMGDPEKDKELWEERSPLNYTENIKAPMVLIHGTNDPRCPVSESRNVRDKLLKLGRKEGKDGEFEYVEYANEGHGAFSDISGRIRSMNLIADFMYRRLR